MQFNSAARRAGSPAGITSYPGAGSFNAVSGAAPRTPTGVGFQQVTQAQTISAGPIRTTGFAAAGSTVAPARVLSGGQTMSGGSVTGISPGAAMAPAAAAAAPRQLSATSMTGGTRSLSGTQTLTGTQPYTPQGPRLDLSVFQLLFDKLDWNNNGIIENDDILAAEELAREGKMSVLFFALLKFADKTKSGSITKPQYTEYLDLVARTWAEMGYTQEDIDKFAQVVDFLTKQKIQTKVTQMRTELGQDWQTRTLSDGRTTYMNTATGAQVNKIGMVKDKDRVKKLWVALGLQDEDEITVKIVLENVPKVKQYVPEILTDYPKIDQDANITLSKKEVEEYINPALKAEYTLKELARIWLHITRSTPSNEKVIATMEDVGNDIEFVTNNIPELKDDFLSICYGKSCSMRKNDFMAYFAAADLWLEERLKGIIGLDDLKKQVKAFYWGVRLNRLRRQGGLDVHSDEAIVLMFKGNPGVGKTTIGRIITKLLYKIEIIGEDKFNEVQRDQMVGAALGQTEQKTEKLIEEARGGVLFVDEAYRLSSDQFGKEAVNCLMRAMTVKGNVIVVAGYPAEMEEWTLLNPGIKRRITYEFVFPNYQTSELARILEGMIKKQGFDTDVPVGQLETLIKKYTTGPQLENFNGGVCEHVLRHAIESLNQREIGAVQEAARNSAKPSTPSVLLKYQDIEYGCKHIPKVPPKV